MKNIIGLVLLLFTFQFFFAGGINDGIEKSFTQGSTSEIEAYFGKTVDLTLLGKESIYSKVQTVQILKQFFIKHPPKAFHTTHNGSSKKGTDYSIGNYVSTNGNFRIYLIYKTVGKTYQIQELSIQTDEKD